MPPHTYETNGAAIYAESFATIRAEANLARFTKDEESVTVRMIHAAGMVGLEEHVRFSPPGMAETARAALAKGAPLSYATPIWSAKVLPARVCRRITR